MILIFFSYTIVNGINGNHWQLCSFLSHSKRGGYGDVYRIKKQMKNWSQKQYFPRYICVKKSYFRNKTFISFICI